MLADSNMMAVAMMTMTTMMMMMVLLLLNGKECLTATATATPYDVIKVTSSCSVITADVVATDFSTAINPGNRCAATVADFRSRVTSSPTAPHQSEEEALNSKLMQVVSPMLIVQGSLGNALSIRTLPRLSQHTSKACLTNLRQSGHLLTCLNTSRRPEHGQRSLGNVLSLATLQNDRFRRSSTSFILSALAVVDTAVLNTSLLRLWIYYQFNVDVRSLTTVGCKIHQFLTYFFHQVNVHRFIAVIWKLGLGNETKSMVL
jgi:hypothetical protein